MTTAKYVPLSPAKLERMADGSPDGPKPKSRRFRTISPPGLRGGGGARFRSTSASGYTLTSGDMFTDGRERDAQSLERVNPKIVLFGLRAIGSAFRQVLTHLTASLLANIVAILLSTPIILVVGAVAYSARSLSLLPLGVAFLVGVLPNPCAAGLHAVAREFATSGYATFAEHWMGLRAHFFPILRAWLVSLVVSLLIVSNLVFYVHILGRTSGVLHAMTPGLLFAWVLVFVIWTAIHLYVVPLVFVQEVKSVRLVYRNAFLMALARPGVTVCVVPIWIVLLVLCSTTGVISFIGLTLGAVIQHTVVHRLLPTFTLRAAS